LFNIQTYVSTAEVGNVASKDIGEVSGRS